MQRRFVVSFSYMTCHGEVLNCSWTFWNGVLRISRLWDILQSKQEVIGAGPYILILAIEHAPPCKSPLLIMLYKWFLSCLVHLSFKTLIKFFRHCLVTISFFCFCLLNLCLFPPNFSIIFFFTFAKETLELLVKFYKQ